MEISFSFVFVRDVELFVYYFVLVEYYVHRCMFYVYTMF